MADNLERGVVRIRHGERSDAGVIAELIVELAEYERLASEVVWDERGLEEALFGPDAVARVLLAETEEGEAVGFALYFPSFSTFLGSAGIWLEDLYVRPAFRRRGVGRLLLGSLFSLTSGRVEWSVLSWNTEAISFYDTLGARPIEGWVTYRWLPGNGPTTAQ